MRRVATVATVCCLALLPLSAQRMGGHPGGGGFAGRGASGNRGVFAFSGVRSGFGLRSFRTEGFGEDGFLWGFRDGFAHHHCFGCRRYGYPSWYGGYGYGSYSSPYLWWDPSYEGSSYDEDQAREAELANEMNYLNLREERLREREEALDRERDREQGTYSGQSQPRASAQVSPSTVLVFRDQHRQEVRNYAIAGQSLWILTEQSAKKVPLEDLDLDATRKANDERGVEFEMPSSDQ